MASGIEFNTGRDLLVLVVRVTHEDRFDIVYLGELDSEFIRRPFPVDVHGHFDQALSLLGKGALAISADRSGGQIIDHKSGRGRVLKEISQNPPSVWIPNFEHGQATPDMR